MPVKVSCVTLLILMLFSGNGCGQAEPLPEPSPKDDRPTGEPQPKLQTTKLWLGPEEIAAELAVTRDQIRKGMMFRKEMGEKEGMLFIFSQPHQVSFYMRNTYIPLSCAYISSDGVIQEIYKMTPLDETPILSQSDQIQYVLEMNQGWFERHGVRTGMLIRTERGSLGETFFGR